MDAFNKSFVLSFHNRLFLSLVASAWLAVTSLTMRSMVSMDARRILDVMAAAATVRP
jgi:hypothetical protein